MSFRIPALLTSFTLAALVAAGCGTKTVDTKNAEKLIGASLGKQLGGKVSVKCPGSVEAKKGGTFDCTATSPDGKEKAQVHVVQKDDKGNIRFALK